MRARAVIGGSFGDEGKGAFTDYLCAKEGAGMVVRFNGGAQAGHTVVAPDGTRHVFHHFGAGTFVGVPTYLSKFFILNPIMYFNELSELVDKGMHPRVYAHPNCLVTTFADMIINQRIEVKRGAGRHGSCGLGVSETINRSNLPNLKLTMSDLWNGRNIEHLLEELCGKYAEFRTGEKIVAPDMFHAFVRGCEQFANYVQPLGIEQCRDPIFEGAQGLLLDQDNKEFFPHVTHSSTGMKNVRILCEQAGIKDIDAYYITRSYLTRHGAGPLPGHDPMMVHFDSTNKPNDWQGSLRFAPLDLRSRVAMYERCSTDAGDRNYSLVVTHCDQLAWGGIEHTANFMSHGETRSDVVSTVENRLHAAR